MIYFFWPKRKVKDWVVNVKINGHYENKMHYHKGFGFIARKNKEDKVCLFSGAFIYIDAKNSHVEITVTENGLSTTSFLGLLKWYLF